MLVTQYVIYTFYPLRPEHVKVELFGRIYQFGLPPETRKNLSAFFTRPQASRLLAGLAIESWDEKILDPACGSGTLLAESYQTKLRIARMQGVNLNYEDLHKTFIEKHIIGIDIMQFAKELTTVNLVLQNPAIKVEPRIFVGDGIKKMAHAEEVEEVDPVQVTIEDYLEISRKRYEELILPREGFDVVVMNPPFTRRERIPERERKGVSMTESLSPRERVLKLFRREKIDRIPVFSGMGNVLYFQEEVSGIPFSIEF